MGAALQQQSVHRHCGANAEWDATGKGDVDTTQQARCDRAAECNTDLRLAQLPALLSLGQLIEELLAHLMAGLHFDRSDAHWCDARACA